MIFARRFFAKMADSAEATISDLGVERWSLRDVDPNVRLEIGPNSESNVYTPLATLTSLTLSLPNDYVNTSYLFGMIQTDGVLKVTVTNPDATTSVVLVQGSSSTYGYYSFQQKVTSVVIYNPTASSINVRYQLVTMPPLDSSASFRGGAVTFGIYDP